MKWVEAIQKVLEESNRPLHSYEIAHIAMQKGWAKSTAMLPDHTVQAAVHKHIAGGNGCGFVMIGEGRVSRTYWLLRKGRP